jgi:predicted acyltransferase
MRMDSAETGNDASIAAAIAPDSLAKPATERLKSLDVMRGFAVVSMIVVNAMAYSSQTYGLDAFGFLSHSPWAGFTFADFVFPAFLFMVGVSISASVRRTNQIDRGLFARVSARTLRLVVLGIVIANIPWTTPIGDWRWLGVLQRIGLCYFVAALLFATTGWRVRAFIAMMVLLLYWPLAAMPLPGAGAANLWIAGANFVSWTDRTLLGVHIYLRGPHGYDPEGLLGTLPAIAQCLLGTMAGEWLLSHRQSSPAVGKLAIAGAVVACLGLAWSPLFPIVKNIWTSSFVLLSTGLAVILLAGLVWLLDQRHKNVWGVRFFEAFGANAILAYALQSFAQFIPGDEGMQSLSAAGTRSGYSIAMALLPVVLFIAILWLPLELMRRKRWIVKI